jgi:hypothetical protein
LTAAWATSALAVSSGDARYDAKRLQAAWQMRRRCSSQAERRMRYVDMHTDMHASRAYVQTYIHAYIHTCMHAHIHIYMAKEEALQQSKHTEAEWGFGKVAC